MTKDPTIPQGDKRKKGRKPPRHVTQRIDSGWSVETMRFPPSRVEVGSLDHRRPTVLLRAPPRCSGVL
jgi:hypothetical protein